MAVVGLWSSLLVTSIVLQVALTTPAHIVNPILDNDLTP